MSIPKRVVYLSGPEDDAFTEAAMKFRLIYEGKLRSTNRDPREEDADYLAVHKHIIRTQFHEQLKFLWNTKRVLREKIISPSENWPRGPIAPERLEQIPKDKKFPGYIRLHDLVAELYPDRGFRFLPLVVEQYDLLCSIDILFLRRDGPGSFLHAGDLDNRIKTLIDALRPPRIPNEFVGANNSPISPLPGQDPFYVLLEDDRLVTHLSVETDVLLDPPTDDETDASKVKLIVTVELRPSRSTMFNLSFV